jgi:hypothetical protein
VEHLREIFWQNVVRDVLLTLSIASGSMKAAEQATGTGPVGWPVRGTVTGPGIPPATPPTPTASTGAAADAPDADTEDDADTDDDAPAPGPVIARPAPFDGRVGIITTLGQRIPIADVHPLFACSVPNSPEQRLLSCDVQCSVFRITTPTGEVYTLPVSFIAAVHSLSDELVSHLEAASVAAQAGGSPVGDLPFGFAAYTQLARQTGVSAQAEPEPAI